jgi:hypothetical protein
LLAPTPQQQPSARREDEFVEVVTRHCEEATPSYQLLS